MWDGQSAGVNTYVWDPATNAVLSLSSVRNIFCGASTLLADGRLFSVGGHTQLHWGLRAGQTFNATTNQWVTGPDMADPRWYPSVLSLPDGRALVVAGESTCDQCNVPIPQIYAPETNSWSTLSNAFFDFPYYPHLYVLPDGRVFVPSTTREPIVSQVLNIAQQTWTAVDSAHNFDGGSSVMYLPGKFLKTGTSVDPDGPVKNSASKAYVIDMTEPSPAWRQIASMQFARTYHSMTQLPDGTVLVTGGGTNTNAIGLSTAVKPAELWDPVTETWTTLGAMQAPRLYHSVALLLPDARVLVSGGGRFNTADDPEDQESAEIFSPPYLFKGPRPIITSAPAQLVYGQDFTIQTPDADRVASVALMRLGAVTHSANMSQSYLPLTFTQGAGTLTVTGPANRNLSVPGPYMLFIVDTTGVPSIAAMTRLPSPGEDFMPPTAPGDVSTTSSTGAIGLSWTASTDDTGVTSYNIHRSTTPGFTPAAANKVGTTAGTAYTDTSFVNPGTYYYVVTAQDAKGNVSGPSNEATASGIVDTTPPAVAVTSPSAGSSVQGVVSVTATATDDVAVAGVQFLLDGANLGSEVTGLGPYSVNWNTAGTTNGSHTLSARARDGRGNQTLAANVAVTVANTAPSGLIAGYNFNEGSGTTLTDVTGHGLSGTINGATWTTGKNGGGLLFNGTTNFVDLGNSTSLQLTGSMTLEAWINANANPADDGQIIAKSSGSGWQLKTSPDTGPHTFGLAVSPNSSTNTQRYSTTTRSLNVWYHVAGVYDAAARTMTLYVNGAPVNGTLTGTIPASQFNQTVNVNIGRRTGGYYFKGTIDDVRIYGRALSQAEIQLDMNTPVGGAPPPDTTLPAVSVTSPTGGSVAGTLNITASATDNVAMGGVTFLLDGTPIGAEVTGAGPTYTYSWNSTGTSDGAHTLSARARDAANNTATSAGVSVTVANVDVTGPAVSVTAPAGGANVAGIITLQASATDNVAMAGVQFFLDGNAIGSEVTGAGPTYSRSWNSTTVADGPHTVSARARDTSNNTTTTSDVGFTITNTDTTQPSVSLTAPANGATVLGTINVTASATDNVAMAGVQFYLDGNPLGAEVTGAGPTYTRSWTTTTTTNGEHTLTAVARDASNNTRTTSGVIVTVNNDLTGPTISLTAPGNGATVLGTINVTASATDNVQMAGVQFFLDGNPLGAEVTGAGPTYTRSWNTTTATNGSHTLTARARDTSNNTTSTSDVTVTVNNDITGPSVSLTAPSNGATVSGTISVTASATDNVAMAGVQFLLDGANLGAEVLGAGPTYTFSWNTTTASAGSHTLSARARDASGNTTLATSISVTVSNAVSGLVAGYAFNQGSGTTAVDSSGNGITGTIAGATWTTAGKNGNALSFNGSSAYVDLGAPAALNGTGSMTWEAWVRATSSPADDGQIIARSNSGGGWQLKTSPDTGPQTFGVAISGSGGRVQRYSNTIRALNTWYHVAGVYNATARTLDIYVNGVLDNGVLRGGPVPASQNVANVNVNIGRRSGGFYFAGVIDDVRVYNRALTQAEIQSDMNTPVGVSPPAPLPEPLAARLRLTLRR
jgi:hypothetical protein